MSPVRVLSVLVFLLPLAGCGIFGAEEPAFESVTKDEAFEVRDYPPLVVAEVKVTGNQKEAGSRGFRKLAGYTLETLPVPDDSDVKLLEMPAARFAVLKFSGNAPEKYVQDKMRELLNMTRERELTVVGEVTLAQYNPPWIPGFFRRNEVMVEITS